MKQCVMRTYKCLNAAGCKESARLKSLAGDLDFHMQIIWTGQSTEACPPSHNLHIPLNYLKKTFKLYLKLHYIFYILKNSFSKWAIE